MLLPCIIVILLAAKIIMSIMRIALFPGTFDPVTLGHIDIIERALPLFDKLYIGIGQNSAKKPLFKAEERVAWFQQIYEQDTRVEAILYQGLTVDICKKIGATVLVRGIRYVSDFEYEKAIADVNRSLDDDIETIFLTCRPVYTSVASTLVRDICTNGGDVKQFVPDVVYNSLKAKGF
jgi:pantetheine-phosphate adenylyltransferase